MLIICKVKHHWLKLNIFKKTGIITPSKIPVMQPIRTPKTVTKGIVYIKAGVDNSIEATTICPILCAIAPPMLSKI